MRKRGKKKKNLVGGRKKKRSSMGTGSEGTEEAIIREKTNTLCRGRKGASGKERTGEEQKKQMR